MAFRKKKVADKPLASFKITQPQPPVIVFSYTRLDGSYGFESYVAEDIRITPEQAKALVNTLMDALMQCEDAKKAHNFP